ncbi:MAG: TOBE domain-containing protein [Thermoplasmata archaeon]|nr:TOBE domain-containing protein [Thermoplasmata archaeon]MCI4353852.1 TOBE domain-containing protein [Thermoplasmata archaeon]
MKDHPREVVLTPLDRALLGSLTRASSLVEACERVGISRDRGVYRLRRLGRALRRPVTVTRKGGPEHGTTRLNDLGLALLAQEPGSSVEAARAGRTRSMGSVLTGVYRAGPPPTVTVRGGPRLAVAFDASPGERVSVRLDPESVLLATRRFDTSARNVLPGVVRTIDRSPAHSGGGRVLLGVQVGSHDMAVALTESAVAALRLRPGRAVFLYVKATALRRRATSVPTRGSLPR